MTPITDERGQCAVVEALQSGRASGEAHALQRIDTHLSRVFIAQRLVYKLSRARRHPFVDLTTPARRRAAATAELAVNRVLAPAIYDRIAAVTCADDGALTLDGAGSPVDWVVVMKPIKPGAILSEMAEYGQLSTSIVSELADAIARFHANLAPVRGGAGRPAQYARVLDQLRETETQGAAASGVRRRSRRLFERLADELDRVSPLIEARRSAGWVRRGHGDLHLRNICLYEGRVTAFDALAFDPALATGDILYDWAFLLMDLQARGLSVQANLAMNRYWDAMGQPETALALLPFFMSLRAAVLMAVRTEAGSLAEASAYHNLALRLLRPRSPRLVAVGGLSGSGKSVLARQIAPRLPGACGGRLLASDEVRKRLAGVDPHARLAQAAYAPGPRAAVYRVLTRRARQSLAAGVSAVADATFQDARARRAIVAAAQRFSFAGFWLCAPGPVRATRIAARAGEASDMTAELARLQIEPARVSPPWTCIDAARAPEAIMREITRRLGRARRGSGGSPTPCSDLPQR